MTFSNYALRSHKDFDHWVIYHLEDISEGCRRSLNQFLWINIVPCSVVEDVNVNFDTCIAWQRQMCGWLFLRYSVRVVNPSITHDYLVPSLSFNVFRSSGNSNSNLASGDVKLRPWFTPVCWYRCTTFEIPSKHDTASNFLWINFNIITRNYCLKKKKTTLILVVAFLLSVSIFLRSWPNMRYIHHFIYQGFRKILYRNFIKPW